MGNLVEIQSVKEVLMEASRLNEWLKGLVKHVGLKPAAKH